jgi:hypothetical protein
MKQKPAKKPPAIYVEISNELRVRVAAKAAREDVYIREVVTRLLEEWVRK